MIQCLSSKKGGGERGCNGCNQNDFSACRYKQDIWLCNLDWKIKKVREGKKTTKEAEDQADRPLTSNAKEVDKQKERVDAPAAATCKPPPHKPGYPE